MNADIMTREEAVSALSNSLGMPVITVVSGWIGERRVDFGEEALRAFLHVFDAEVAAWEDRAGNTAELGDEIGGCDEVAIFLVGRGGFPEFAQGVCRALRGRNIRATAVIPAQINGAIALAALGMARRLMHPYAAIGAYDCPALGGARAAPDVDILREIEGFHKESAHKQVFHKQESSAHPTDVGLLGPDTLIAIAHQRRQARHARQLLGRLLGEAVDEPSGDSAAHGRQSGGVTSALSSSVLGNHLALSAAELNTLGVASQTAAGQQAALIWRIYESYEQEFKVLHPAVPRYTESEFADEVEFAPAMEIKGAMIEGAQQKFVYELDTGRPDPESGMLDGVWSW